MKRLAIIGLLLLAGAGAAETAPRKDALAQAVPVVGITVADMDDALAFYTGVLPFEKVADAEAASDACAKLEGVFGARLRVCRLRLGDEEIELRDYLAPEGDPYPASSRGNDQWFQHVAIIVRDMDAAYAHLRAHNVRHASTGPQTLPDWNPNAGGIRAFYFKDPDGHFLEILQFPEGKGAAKWHEPTERLFLGIDHTAIVVRDTEASLAFYRDTLGLQVAGTSENWGTEQEHLNNVFGARLRITGLKPAEGPAIEFLEYLAPSDGRDFPPTESNDLAAWQITLRTGDAREAERALRATRTDFVSPGVVATPAREFGFSEGLLVRDPDGHFIRIVE